MKVFTEVSPKFSVDNWEQVSPGMVYRYAGSTRFWMRLDNNNTEAMLTTGEVVTPNTDYPIEIVEGGFVEGYKP